MKEASLEDIKKAGVPAAAAQLLYDKLQNNVVLLNKI